MTITFDNPVGRTRPEGKLKVVDRWLDHVDVYEMTLAEYHANVLWHAKRSAYAAAFPDAGCFICGRRDYQLHHRRYDNLGQEDWDELVPLCPDHHYEIEKHIGKGYTGVTRANAHLDFVRRKSSVRALEAPQPLVDACTSRTLSPPGT